MNENLERFTVDGFLNGSPPTFIVNNLSTDRTAHPLMNPNHAQEVINFTKLILRVL